MNLLTLRIICLTAVATFATAALSFSQPTGEIVYIDGTKYHVHKVEKGQTLYSLSKHYGVTIDTIVASNPAVADGLKAGSLVKIPVQTAETVKRPKKEFSIHTVKAGETLYAISRRYSISVETLLADNDNADPSHLAIGTKLYIRKSEIGQTSADVAEQELTAKSETMSEVANGNFSYHVVHRGETAASIASRFATTEQELLSLNGYTSANQLRQGTIIKVPSEPIAIDEETTAEHTAKSNKSDAQFRTLDADHTAKVALMLPLTSKGSSSANYIDFYQGFMLGLDRLRMAGRSIDLTLYDTAHSHTVIADILSSDEIADTDLIIGPVYEDELIPVCRYAEQHSTPVVSPLASSTDLSSPILFRMAPNAENKYDKVRSLFDGSRRVVFITSDSVDSEFESEIRTLAGTTPIDTHRYEYEHPSVIERRLKAREASGIETDEPISPSDLSGLLHGDMASVFVILSDNETEVDRILAALASANNALKARSRSVVPFVVLGNSRWNRYKTIDRTMFFTDNVIMLSSYHASHLSERVRETDSRYAESFGSIPSPFTYRGFDAATIFVGALYGGISATLDGYVQTPLDTPYLFQYDTTQGLYANTEWVRINYRSDFTIKIE